MADNHAKHARQEVECESPLARTALRFTAFTERWLPDAFGFVLVGTIVVLLFGLGTGEPLLKRPDNPTATKGNGLVDAVGLGFWSLITFTLQMAMIIIGGYAVATSGPVARLVTRLARIPKSPRRAVAFVAGVAISDRDRLLKRYKNLSAVDFAVGAPLPLATGLLVNRPARRADAGWTAQALRS